MALWVVHFTHRVSTVGPHDIRQASKIFAGGFWGGGDNPFLEEDGWDEWGDDRGNSWSRTSSSEGDDGVTWTERISVKELDNPIQVNSAKMKAFLANNGQKW